MRILVEMITALFASRKAPRTEPRPRITRAAPAPSQIDVTARVTVAARVARTEVLRGRCWVIDGDTIVIGQIRIRIAGIDAPELDHPWGNQAKWALINLCKGQTITAELSEDRSHDRIVASCFLEDGRDLAAEMVRRGLAIDWPKFSGGKYRLLEPEGIRRKHWRAHNRQIGKSPPSLPG